MTKKPLHPLDDPPTASSSEDDEGDTSAEEEDENSSSEEEDEPTKPPSSAVTIAVPGKPTAVIKHGSDSDSGSETETDSDSETEQASKNPNSRSEKSTAVTVVATNPKKKEATLALPATKPSSKRPSEGTTSRENETKRAKKVGEEPKKPAFQRLWSEEDEIALLQGMIDFKDETGKIPYEDTNGFYEFMKKSISVEVSKSQFMDKIRSLKKKYTGKGKNGKEVSFTKPHDLKSFGLSKFIWGPDGMGIESAKSNGISKKSQSKVKKLENVKQELFSVSRNGKRVEEEDDDDKKKKVLVVAEEKVSDWFEDSFLVRSIAGFGVDECTVKQRWSKAPVEPKKKIEEKIKALQANEIEFVLQKTMFLHEVASMIAEVSSKH